MTESSATAEMSDSIFEHEMFDAGNIKSGYMLEAIRHIEATWAFSSSDIAEELHRMETECLVLRRSGFGGDVGEYWEATLAGRVAREIRWQQRGMRTPRFRHKQPLLRPWSSPWWRVAAAWTTPK
ncbi:hypothetical protein [Paraburkholderia haematera]|uniref:hypothetical protein n=1 Tax=Paraburkholderia haematera TaxID=2793077 RepID=UPI001B8AB57F|nr:hypothetical protein [Paraburkholderia haematera]